MAVLILVLVEDGLGAFTLLIYSILANKVLILVLVEDGLGEGRGPSKPATDEGLNPCFSGGWSRRTHSGSYISTQ